MNKKTLFFIVIAVVVGALVYNANKFSDSKSSSTVLIVNLSDNGFIPEVLTINKGDTVKLTTTGGKPFWPASDLHPTHGVYPEFDPKRPIQPGDSWSFKFDKVGEWKFHDHLYPTHRGIIKVIDGKSSFNTNQDWEQLIRETLKNQGLDSAFEQLANLYAAEPAFAAECHGYVHILGEFAFEKYSNGENINLTPKTSYCGYGFYHGFMESLLLSSGDIEEARRFCAEAGEMLAVQTSDAEGACYHGIGHGTVDGSDPTAWGDAEKMIEPGMKICEQIAGHDRSLFGKLYRCVSGVFNSIEILSGDDKYQLTALKNDPFSFCKTKPQEFLEACYTNMLPALMRITNNDFLKSAAQISAIPERQSYTIRGYVISSLFHEFVRMNFSEPDFNVVEGIKICRSFIVELRLSCIDGLAGGHMKYGEPRIEYVKGLAFCGSDLLTENEANVCFQHILTRLSIWYTREKSEEICAEVPIQYRNYCTNKS